MDLARGRQRSLEFWTPAFIKERYWSQDRGNGRIRSGWSVSQALRRHRIPLRVVRPLRWNREARDRARALGADVLLSGCFMLLVPTEILDCFGGVSMHVMSPEFDTGDVIAARRVPWAGARCVDDWDLAAGRAAGSLAAEELSRYPRKLWPSP